MTNQPFISVLVATYNHEKYIGRCLRSLIQQNFPSSRYEIIVIDDGSTDRTPFALELFHDAIHNLKNNTNIGLPASLNRGINYSRGDYIVRVDSDDYVNSNFLLFLSYFLEQNADIDSVACDYWLFNQDEHWIERVNCNDHPIACGIMFRKEHIVEIGMYDEDFVPGRERVKS